MLENIANFIASLIAMIIVILLVALVMALPALVVTVCIEYLFSVPIDRVETWLVCVLVMTGLSMFVSFITKD